MAHVWHQTIEINADTAKNLIESQHHLSINSIILLDEGWDNIVYLVNQELIFRFPRRELGVMCLKNEINLLPYIASRLTFPISNPQWIGSKCELYPYPFAGYRMLAGKPLCEATRDYINNVKFAKTLAKWLKELHSIPVLEEHVTVISGDQDWRLNHSHRIKSCRENLSHYQIFFEQAGFSLKNIERIIERLNQLNLHSQKKCYLHGDLYSRHIIVDDSLLPVGLIDWGDVHIGPPGIDLAVGMIFTRDVLLNFLDAYGVSQEDIQIMLFHSFCHSMSFLPYAYQQNKTSLKQWAQLVLNRVICELEHLWEEF